jgi:CHASE3 domain sensor protein
MSRNSLWNRIPLRVQGILYNSLPLIAVLMTAVFAWFSNLQRERTELSLNRHFEMVENLIDIQTTLLNAEAGLRGYLLTHDAALLQPFDAARDLIPPNLARIRTLVDSIPKPDKRAQKQTRFNLVETQVNAQLAAITALPTVAGPSAEQPAEVDDKLRAQIIHNQSTLQATCQQLSDLRTDEQLLLAKRLDDIRSVRQRDYLLIFLSVFVGLVSRAVALFFFHKRVVRRVRQLTENVRSLRHGTALVLEPSDHADDIGELERELARVSDLLSERRT